MTYQNELKEAMKKLGGHFLGALATSAENRTTVRTMSFIVHEGSIYFQTGSDLLKYNQIKENRNVAICSGNIQIEGIAEILGQSMQHADIMKIYKQYYENSYATYSHLEKEVLIKISPKKITEWEYDNEGKPYRIFLDLVQETICKEPYVVSN
ncbi:MAG: pyridoxamine 5'-phosphate oxidase family protein [Spirochaetaceae bacterium]|jgi:general stress protein 26|nr:pyridoxamine 5'-phosphate oxidase family protein [Spirochaetaceae bacterium]